MKGYSSAGKRCIIHTKPKGKNITVICAINSKEILGFLVMRLLSTMMSCRKLKITFPSGYNFAEIEDKILKNTTRD